MYFAIQTFTHFLEFGQAVLISLSSGDYLHINISAKISEDDWVALGLSDDRKMGEDDVIAVYKNISIKSFSAASLLDPHGKCFI